jgi:hypothetical protein
MENCRGTVSYVGETTGKRSVIEKTCSEEGVARETMCSRKGSCGSGHSEREGIAGLDCWGGDRADSPRQGL